jgi:hypothetical protein
VVYWRKYGESEVLDFKANGWVNFNWLPDNFQLVRNLDSFYFYFSMKKSADG